MLTRIRDRGIEELAKHNGAVACFVKRHMGIEDLDRAIQYAIALNRRAAQGRSVPARLVSRLRLAPGHVSGWTSFPAFRVLSSTVLAAFYDTCRVGVIPVQ